MKSQCQSRRGFLYHAQGHGGKVIILWNGDGIFRKVPDSRRAQELDLGQNPTDAHNGKIGPESVPRVVKSNRDGPGSTPSAARYKEFDLEGLIGLQDRQLLNGIINGAQLSTHAGIHAQ